MRLSLLWLILLVPSVGATQQEFFDGLYPAGTEGRVESWLLHQTTCVDLGSCSALLNITRVTNGTLVGNFSRLHIEVRQIFQLESSTVGVWRFNLTVDGVEQPACQSYVGTWDNDPTVADGTDTNAQFLAVSRCYVWNDVFGERWFNVTRTILSGAPAALITAHTTLIVWVSDVLLTEETSLTNEILEALAIFTPMFLWVLAVVWAEIQRDGLLYILAAAVGVFVVVDLWSELASIRILFVGIILAIIYRGIMEFRSTPQ